MGSPIYCFTAKKLEDILIDEQCRMQKIYLVASEPMLQK
jgi:hypothetical protein